MAAIVVPTTPRVRPHSFGWISDLATGLLRLLDRIVDASSAYYADAEPSEDFEHLPAARRREEALRWFGRQRRIV